MARARVRGASRRAAAGAKRSGPGLAERLSRALPWALASLLVCVLIGGLIYLPSVMDRYPIEAVKVEGVKDPRRQQEVQLALSGLVKGENFFTLSLASLYGQVRTLEWVADARVRRHWPGAVIISIEERVPVAVWNGEDLVSSAGEPFHALAKYSVSRLPHLFGPPDRLAAVMDYYHSMSKVLAPAGTGIRRLDVDPRLTATLELENGVRVVVDRDQYARKLRRFVRLYQGVLGRDIRGVAKADLRYVDGLAVQWRHAIPQPDNKGS